MTDTLPSPSTPTDLRAWLTDRVASVLGRPAADIDPQTSLTHYGFDSVYAIALCGEIEDVLAVAVDPVVLWSHDTVDTLADHLSHQAAGRL